MNQIKIIDFKDEHDKRALELFYRHVFHLRKEFEYARLPSWSHRYSLVEHSIMKLAVIGTEIVGSLGVLTYEGYAQGKKKKIGFFVDNCVLPEHHGKHDEIMSPLFKSAETQAKKDKLQVLIGWEYTKSAENHEKLFKSMNYSRLDGINWFGGGTKHVDMFSINGFNLPLFWQLGLKLLSLKHHYKEATTAPLKDEILREMNDSDITQAVNLINSQNAEQEFSPRYTSQSLKKTMQRYHAKGLVAELNGKIIGVLICFMAPWSGWMYGKPVYEKSHGFFLIKHPLEFAVAKEHSERIAASMLFRSMSEEKMGKYSYFVDVFDRRVEWMRKAFGDMGADELPYDYGTLFIKDLTGKNQPWNAPFTSQLI